MPATSRAAGRNVEVMWLTGRLVPDRDKNFTRAKMERRLAQIEESVARYLRQLDSADRQEASQARATKIARLKEKIAKLKEEGGNAAPVWTQGTNAGDG